MAIPGLVAAPPRPALPPVLREALTSLFTETAPKTGAHACALGGCEPPSVEATWNCDRSQLLRMFAQDDVCRRALQAAGSLVALGEDTFRTLDAAEPGALRALPLRTARAADDFLFLLYPSDFEASAAQAANEASLATMAALVVDREYFAEEARRAQEARDHFLIAIHHELRTPATALMLEAGLLQSGLLGTLPPRLQQSLQRLEGQVTDLVRVVQRVLDLAQLETSGLAATEDLVDPREAIVTLARHVEPAAERRGIAISLFFPRVLPLVQTDQDRFRRVLLYLLANALKYSERGHVQVRVERQPCDSPNGKRDHLLVIRVVDSGCGIPAEDLGRVFEPFAQVDEGARTDSHQRGVGLGLPLARKLARSLGGDVEVESTVGKGTTASFSLPYRPPALRD